MSKKLLLIDGDLILHRGCVAVETDVRWDDENHMLFSSFPEAWHNVTAGITRLFERFDTEEHIVTLSSPRNFRKDIDPTYKGNRTGMRKPLCFARAKEQLREDYKTYEFDGLEADDVMGIFGSRLKDSIVCTMDKDLKTVPCTIFDGEKVFSVSEMDADYWHLYQTLVGDTADGYPGCKGIGPKKAEALLSVMPDGPINPEITRVEWLWDQVVKAFEKAGLAEADALRQARLARILRDSDWDSKRKEPILWQPTL